MNQGGTMGFRLLVGGFRRLLASTLLLSLLPLTAHAQFPDSWNYRVIQEVREGELQRGRVYFMRYHCDDRGTTPLDFIKTLDTSLLGAGFTGQQAERYTHGFVISGSQPGTDPRAETFLQGLTQPVIPVDVFSVEDLRGVIDRQRAVQCNGKLFLNGAKDLYLTPFSLVDAENFRGDLFETVASASLFVSPIYSLISGSDLSDSVSGRIDELNTFIAEYQKWLSTFQSSGYRADPINLFEGSFTIQTGASNIYVEIIHYPSLLLAPEFVPFRESYGEVFGDGGGTGIDLNAIKASCERLETGLRDAGLRASEDIGYILFNQAWDATANKAQLRDCLGRHLKTAIDNMPLYERIPEDARLTPADMNPAPTRQQIEREMENNFLALRQAARRFASTGRLTARLEQRVSEAANETISLVDETYDALISSERETESDVFEVKPTELFSILKDVGYPVWHCRAFTRIHPSLNPQYDGASLMAAVFRSAEGGLHYREDALALRFLFEDNKVSEVIVTNEFVNELATQAPSCGIATRVAGG